MISKLALKLQLAFLLMSAAGAFATPVETGALLFQDDFRAGLAQWHIEAVQPGTITARNGVLDIDVPAGVTVWFKPELTGPVVISFTATAVSAGGAHDRVSDLNCFWMAQNADGVVPVYARKRSGEFADYNNLLTYYVGLGGNSNTTTRFRRYIGSSTERPLLPEHDLSAPAALLVPNRQQTITLVADGSTVEYWRDDQRLIHYQDDAPYRRGGFAFRTVNSHLRIQQFRVYRAAARQSLPAAR